MTTTITASTLGLLIFMLALSTSTGSSSTSSSSGSSSSSSDSSLIEATSPPTLPFSSPITVLRSLTSTMSTTTTPTPTTTTPTPTTTTPTPTTTTPTPTTTTPTPTTTTPTPTTTTTASSTCQTGHTFIASGNMCVFTLQESLTKDNAKLRCEGFTFNGLTFQLTYWENQTVYEDVVTHLTTVTGLLSVWTGLVKISLSSNWIWELDTAHSTYLPWGAGNPSSLATRCSTLQSTDAWLLNDKDCTESTHVMCVVLL